MHWTLDILFLLFLHKRYFYIHVRHSLLYVVTLFLHLQLLEQFHKHCLCTTLNINNTEVLENAKITSIKAIRSKSLQRRAGNLSRMGNQHIPRIIPSKLRTVMAGISPPDMRSTPLKTPRKPLLRTKGTGKGTATLYHQALTRPSAAGAASVSTCLARPYQPWTCLQSEWTGTILIFASGSQAMNSFSLPQAKILEFAHTCLFFVDVFISVV